MLRAATSNLARRTASRSFQGAPSSLISRVPFHSTGRKEEKLEEHPLGPPLGDQSHKGFFGKGGLFGTGYSEAWALPLGVGIAMPILSWEWYVPGAETQLVFIFSSFVLLVQHNFGGMIADAIIEDSRNTYKTMGEMEDKFIEKLEGFSEQLRFSANMTNDFADIHQLRMETYEKLNVAGAVKPQYELKTQMERLLHMIEQEETSVTEKTKIALMEEAVASVSNQFSATKALRKSALDSAIAKIKGASSGGKDPVKEEFVNFFKNKAAEVSKTDQKAAEKEERDALIAKLNAVAKNEGFFFSFDGQGKPVITAKSRKFIDQHPQ